MIAPRERLPLKVIAARISLAPKVADIRKPTEDRMLAVLKANAVPMGIVGLKVAAQRVNAAKGIVVRRGDGRREIVVRISLAPKMADDRKGIVDRMLAVLKANVAPMVIAVQKAAALKEIVVRRVRVARRSFASSTRITTVASRRTNWPSWSISSMNSTPITMASLIRPS